MMTQQPPPAPEGEIDHTPNTEEHPQPENPSRELNWANLEPISQTPSAEQEQTRKTLYKYRMQLLSDQIPPEIRETLRLTDSDCNALSRYKCITTVWSTRELPDAMAWYEAMRTRPRRRPQDRKPVHITILASGLASNESEWEIEPDSQTDQQQTTPKQTPDTSFLAALHDAYVTDMLDDMRKESESGNNPDLCETDFMFWAIASPGFGGSELVNREDANTETCGSNPYARYLERLCHAYDIPPDQTVFIGHSHGAEAGENDLFTTGQEMQKICLNPSSGSSRDLAFQPVFRLLHILSQIADTADLLSKRLGTDYLTDRAISKLRVAVTAYFVGLPIHESRANALQQSLVRMHLHEMRTNTPAFYETLKNLTLPSGPEDMRRDTTNISVVASTNDRLTRPDHTVRSFSELIKQLQEKGVTPKAGENILNDHVVLGGHDAVFHLRSAQRTAVQVAAKKMETVRSRDRTRPVQYPGFSARAA